MIPYLKEALKNLIKKSVTERFPMKSVKTASNYRGKIEFNKDKCIGCGMCTRVCASGAVTKKLNKVEGGNEVTLEFDLSLCTFCGFCSEFCARKAIKLTNDCIIVTDNKSKLKVIGSFFKQASQKPKFTKEQLAKIAALKENK